MRKYLLLFLLLTLLPACAKQGTSTFHYDDPDATQVENQTVVNKPFNQVWDGLVAELASSYFVINNIDKASRLINISFSTDHPENYIDCGETTRVTTRGDVRREYKYDCAESYDYLLEGRGIDYFEETVFVKRKTSLEGRINVYLAPIDSKSTRVSVNVRYVFSIKQRTQTALRHMANPAVVMQQNTDTSEDSCAFSTKVKFEDEINNGDQYYDFTCMTKGALENDILDIAKKI